uniref:Uncharacterized protein n=1 Tax=Avena sativa TaxID=4498 RepID=A0ACD5TAD6_AVESA
MEIMAGDQPQHHFVLVHGMNHGAWCWYMALTLLRLAGHRATALDMAGCGVHPARVDEVLTFQDYSRPLLDALAALPSGDRESCSSRTATAAVGRAMAATSDELLAYVGDDFFMDSQDFEQRNPNISGRPFIFGPEFMARKVYNMSPLEDLNLGLMLIKPANSFTTNNSEEVVMRDENLLTAGRYGSVRRVYVTVEHDRAIPVGFQRRMIAQSPGIEVEGIAAGGADHMVMISRSEDLAELLVRIAGGRGTVRASKANDSVA